MKHHNIINSIVVLLIACLFAACKQENIPTFNSEYDSVRFPEKRTENNEPNGYNYQMQQFLSTYSFIEDPGALSHDFSIPVMLVGTISEHDREVLCEVDTDKTTAPAETYKILNGKIPAGKIQGEVIVRLFNNEGLKKEDFVVCIKIKGSKELHAGPDSHISALITWGNRLPAPKHFKHYITYNMLIEGTPAFDSSSEEYFSPAALGAIIKAFNWYDWDDKSVHGSDYNSPYLGSYKYLPSYSYINKGGAYKIWAKKLDAYINEYNTQHPDKPLVHDAGLNIGKKVEARKY